MTRIFFSDFVFTISFQCGFVCVYVCVCLLLWFVVLLKEKSEKSEEPELVRLAIGCWSWFLVIVVAVVVVTVFSWMLCDYIENCIKTPFGSLKS